MAYLNHYMDAISKHPLIYLAVYAIIVDVIFGTLRCLKERKPNSNIGINGMIRKFSMIMSMALLVPIDMTMDLNLVGFVPEELTAIIHLSTVGLSDFFAIMYLMYEIMSILKNMTLCGLPIRGIWEATHKFLQKFTDELPDED